MKLVVFSMTAGIRHALTDTGEKKRIKQLYKILTLYLHFLIVQYLHSASNLSNY